MTNAHRQHYQIDQGVGQGRHPDAQPQPGAAGPAIALVLFTLFTLALALAFDIQDAFPEAVTPVHLPQAQAIAVPPLADDALARLRLEAFRAGVLAASERCGRPAALSHPLETTQ
jgi:hypothetical protein